MSTLPQPYQFNSAAEKAQLGEILTRLAVNAEDPRSLSPEDKAVVVRFSQWAKTQVAQRGFEAVQNHEGPGVLMAGSSGCPHCLYTIFNNLDSKGSFSASTNGTQLFFLDVGAGGPAFDLLSQRTELKDIQIGDVASHYIANDPAVQRFTNASEAERARMTFPAIDYAFPTFTAVNASGTLDHYMDGGQKNRQQMDTMVAQKQAAGSRHADITPTAPGTLAMATTGTVPAAPAAKAI